MLHKEAVDPSTLELLKSLQKKEYLQGFYLAGGTALALYYGHRKSVDIDLFTNEAFGTKQLLEKVMHDFSYQLSFSADNTLKGVISKVKVDIIAHTYPYIQEPKAHNEIFLVSEEDIIAMKLNAISVSGQRSKDFIDIYYALNNFSIAEMVSLYKEKYEQRSASHILKSLIFFDDVDLQDWPELISEPALRWNEIKKRLEKEVTAYINQD